MMRIVKLISETQSIISEFKANGKRVGLVPTMGALHQGHLSLVAQSKKENDITVVSIFVNPTQFNNPKDLKTYPRVLDKDLDLLSEYEPDLIFIPEVEEVYPEPDTRIFDFGDIEKVMEGKNRPGHFNGVAQVVSKLFSYISPNNAYFGQKDFQQVAVIKQMTKDLKLDIKIVPCPIIRELDGLAMSSRNMLLSELERKNAARISKTLIKACNLVPDFGVSLLKDWVVTEINSNAYLKVEYFEIVDATSLQSIEKWEDSDNRIACITVQVGKVRLIDNISL
ncbi:MAG: pantoate--beta-alanine ligase [Ancylomarina sp.]|jgi:pantoate--beta-alanine ligase